MNMIAQGGSISDPTEGQEEAILAEMWVRFGTAAAQHQHPNPARTAQPQPTIANTLLFVLFHTHMNMIAQGGSISDPKEGQEEAILAEILVRFG